MKKNIFLLLPAVFFTLLFPLQITAADYYLKQNEEDPIPYFYLNDVSNHIEGNYYSNKTHSLQKFTGHNEKRIIISDDQPDAEIVSIKIYAFRPVLTLFFSDGTVQKLSKASLPDLSPYLYEENVVLDTSLEESPVMGCSIAGIKFKDENLNDHIAQKSYSNQNDLQKSALDLLRLWKDDYLEAGIDLLQDEISSGYNIPASLNWQYNDKLELVFHSDKLICLKRSHYEYTGGAHGNYFQEYMIWDRMNSRQVELQDLLKAGSQKAIKELLSEKLLEQYNLDDPLELLFERDFPISEDICITPEGICFQYDPYDIACYAVGSIELYLDYDNLIPYITDYYASIK